MNYIGFDIVYEVPYDTQAVHTIADALAQAVNENWSEQDAPEFREPFGRGRLETWLEGVDPEKMERVPDELADEEDTERFTEELGFRNENDKDWVMGRAIMQRLKWT